MKARLITVAVFAALAFTFTPSTPASAEPLDCPPGYVPGWLDETGQPTSCIRDCPAWDENGNCIDGHDPVEPAPDPEPPVTEPAPSTPPTTEPDTPEQEPAPVTKPVPPAPKRGPVADPAPEPDPVKPRPEPTAEPTTEAPPDVVPAATTQLEPATEVTSADDDPSFWERPLAAALGLIPAAAIVFWIARTYIRTRKAER